MGDRITKLQGTSTRPGVYKCKDCRKPLSVTVATVIERSHIPLSKWLLLSQAGLPAYMRSRGCDRGFGHENAVQVLRTLTFRHKLIIPVEGRK